jgi:heptosyltransferase-3
MFYLGAPMREIPKARLFVRQQARPRAIAVLHSAASAPDKTWPAENFVALADELLCRSGLMPVFIGGAADDLTPFERFEVVRGAPLEQVKSLIAEASLFIGNDSGPAHMAAALDVPLVVMFGPSDSVIWGPWKAPAETLVARGPIDSIEVEQVLAAVERLGVAA